MAETTKLSVGQALEKLRSDTPSKANKITKLDEKIDALDKEMQRLRSERHRLERSQRLGTKRD